MKSWRLFFAALIGFAGVGLGAIGAHAIKLPPGSAESESFRMAVTLLLVHGVAAIALELGQNRSLSLNLASISWMVGSLLFSGSIVAKLTLGAPTTLAPIGGILMMIGWLALAFGAVSGAARPSSTRS